MLNSGWTVRPVGQQVPLDTFPMSAVVAQNERFMIVLNGGYHAPSLSVVDLQSGTVTSRTSVPDAWLGMALSKEGKTLWVSGGSTAGIFEFTLNDNGQMQPSRTFQFVEPANRTWQDFIGDIAVTPDGRLIYAADLYHDQILIVNPQSGIVIDKFKTCRRPYRIRFHPDGKSLFVTSWADGTLNHYQADNGNKLETMPVGLHPTDILWRPTQNGEESADPNASYTGRLFIAAANTNNVYSIGVTDTKDLHLLETINVAMTPMQPMGMTPTALAMSPDFSKIYVVCSDANVVGVVDVTEPRSHVLGFIPTGWYPTAVNALADGRLVVLNGRGLRSYPNPNGPGPNRPGQSTEFGTQRCTVRRCPSNGHGIHHSDDHRRRHRRLYKAGHGELSLR